MGIRILPPASKRERRARLQMLATLRQQGLGVGCLAQTFWTMAVGLELCDTELNNIFNECLDNHLPLWEVEGLKTLDYWCFIDYLSYRSLIVPSCQSVPMADPPQKDESATASLEDSGASLPLSQKRRSRRRREAKSTPVVSSPVDL